MSPTSMVQLSGDFYRREQSLYPVSAVRKGVRIPGVEGASSIPPSTECDASLVAVELLGRIPVEFMGK